VKTGMLPSANCIRAVSETMRRWNLPNLVVDPVMVAKGGATLMARDATRALAQELLPLVTVLTPNIPEAETLLGRSLATDEDYRQSCRDLAKMGPSYVVLKGGHRPGAPIDLLFDGRRFWEFPGERIETRHTHGTGCTFASAIAGYLALGYEVPAAVARAKIFVTNAICNSLAIGHGHGPVWQFGETDG
jgi:hydroxymethylpyrimidine/phosphomethylpyrimidine kinase